jgi:hypothetical protein
MHGRRIAERGEWPFDINHKDKRCADWFHDETRHFGRRFRAE